MLGRPEVDPDRLVLHGISQAGYWVPRAIAFEPRFAAAVADPGVMRVGDSWSRALPDVMKQLLEQGDKKDFDAFMEAGLKDEPDAARSPEVAHGVPTARTRSTTRTPRRPKQHLDADTLARITTPLLITSPDHEQFWPGQSAEMQAAVTTSTLVTFTEAEGADWHCEPAAHGLRDERGLQLARGHLRRLTGRRRSPGPARLDELGDLGGRAGTSGYGSGTRREANLCASPRKRTS